MIQELKTKNKAAVYYNTDDLKKINIAFDDAKYDFDKIQNVLNIWTDIPKKAILTLGMSGKTEEIREALDKIRSFNDSVVTDSFTKSFLKEFDEFKTDISELFDVTTELTLGGPLVKESKKKKMK